MLKKNQIQQIKKHGSQNVCHHFILLLFFKGDSLFQKKFVLKGFVIYKFTNFIFLGILEQG